MTLDLTENQFRLVLKNAPLPAFAHDESGRIRFVNDEFVAVTGFRSVDLETFRALLERACAEMSQVEAVLQQASASFRPDGTPFAIAKLAVRMADGARRVWSLRGYTLGADAAGVRIDVCMAQDVTEAEEARSAAREVEMRARLVAEIGGIGAFEHDHIASVIRADERVRAIFGLSPLPEVAEAEFYSAVHPDDMPELAAIYQGMCETAGEVSRRMIFRVVNRQDGRTRVVDLRLRMFKADGKPLRCLGAVSDITEERAAQQALRDSVARARLATEIGEIGTFEAEHFNRNVFCDARVRELWGYDPDEPMSGEDFLNGVHADDRKKALDLYREACAAGHETTTRTEFRVVNRKTGEVRWLDVRGRILFDNGKPARSIGALTDITEARIADQALRTSEERLRLATEIGEIGAFETDLVGNRLIWDARVRAIWGFEPDDAITIERFFEAVHPDDRERVRQSLERLNDPSAEGRCDIEYRVVNRQDVRERVVSAKARAIVENGRATRIIGALTDVTEERAAEKALRESEARARLAAEIGQIGAFEADMGQPKLVWDKRARELFGFGPDEPVTPFDFLAGIHADDRAAMFNLFERASRQADDPRGEGEFRVVNRRNGEVRTVRSSARVFFENGRPARVIGAITDITTERDASAELERQVEARTRELAQAQTRLAQAQRMEALGHLAGGIAHDFNNVLQAIEAATDLIERKPERENLPRYLRMLREGTKRGSAVSRRLSSLSRRPELEPETVTTAPFLDEIAGVLRRTVEQGTEVETAIARDCPSILGDRRQLETALLNIAANAREAIRGAGRIRLTARADTAQGAAAAPFEAKLRLGNYVRLEISDSGHGMTPDVRARAAEPFFSTKPRGQGVGLGLSMARGFAEQSGGALEIASAPDEGTTVALWLPVAEIAVAETPPPDPGVKGRLLLVDDDPLIRELVSEQLREAGYSVTECEEGRAALQHLDSGLTIDLLLTDFAMPEMNGVTLAREARRRRPRLPVVVLTGYASEAADAAGDTDLSLLRKPIDSAALVGRVAELIAKT